jgi:hypothetical protein
MISLVVGCNIRNGVYAGPLLRLDLEQANELLFAGWILVLIALVIFMIRPNDRGEYLKRYAERYSPDLPLGLSYEEMRLRYDFRADRFLSEAPRIVWRSLRAYTPQQDPELEALRRASGPGPFLFLGVWILSLILLPIIILVIARL